VTDSQIAKLMQVVHQHEGAQALFDRVRAAVSHPDLRRRSQEFVRNCATCALNRIGNFAWDGTQKKPLQHSGDSGVGKTFSVEQNLDVQAEARKKPDLSHLKTSSTLCLLLRC
jgi:hypothetical protein